MLKMYVLPTASLVDAENHHYARIMGFMWQHVLFYYVSSNATVNLIDFHSVEIFEIEPFVKNGMNCF